MNINMTEKITINANTADLGLIDLLVSNGFYASRTEFIKVAIKSKLDSHEEDSKRLLDSTGSQGGIFYVGLYLLKKEELEQLKRKGKTKKIVGAGLLQIDLDIPLELLKETITSIKAYGVVRCAPEVKAHYRI